MSSPTDIQTPPELKAELLAAVRTDLAAAKADHAVFAAASGKTLEQDLGAAARADLVATNAALDGVLPADHTQSEDASVATANAFEAAYENIRRQILAQMTSGADKFLAIVLQNAVDVIDELRGIADEIGVEALTLSAAAATGLLVPPTTDDLETFSDEVADAQDQARFVSRDLSNGAARREAVRTGRTQPTLAPSEGTTVDAQGPSFAQGGGGTSTRVSTSTPAAKDLQARLKAPILSRVGYVLICSALGALARSKSSRAKAEASAEKLRALTDQIRALLEAGFVDTLQQSVQERTNAAISGVIDDLQGALDGVDGFLKTIAGLPGPFASTVSAIGDTSDNTALLNNLSTLCGLKGQRFCDFQGLLEIAASLDLDLGLKFPTLPMVGRVKLTLVAPQAAEVPLAVVVPGQEADLLLHEDVVPGATVLRARFRAEDRPTAADGTGTVAELGGAFGTGPGALRLRRPGATEVDEEFRYSAAAFANGVYTFTLAAPTPAATVAHQRWAIANTDPAALAPVGAVAWDDTVAFAPGAALRMRAVRLVRDQDVTLPMTTVIGQNESWSRAGAYTQISANVLQSTFQNTTSFRTFRSWHIGAPISVDNEPSTRLITGITDGGDTGYDQVTVSGPALAPATAGSGTFRFNMSQSETRVVTTLTETVVATVHDVTLDAPTAKDHGRLQFLPQRTVRVQPDLRDAFLSPTATPASGAVRATDRVLPAGASVFRAVFDDPAQDALFTPILLSLPGGALLSINGGEDLTWTSVTRDDDGFMRFVLGTPTTTPYVTGAVVEVETTSLLSQFKIAFPSDWSDPIDDWLRSLLVIMNRIESQFCRLLSGSNQDLAANFALLFAASSAASLTLTGAKFMLLMWLAPLLIGNRLQSLIDQLAALGSGSAVAALREGRIADFAAMTAAESTGAGAVDAKLEALRARTGDENKFAALARARAEIAGRHQAVVTAGIVSENIKTAQLAETQRRVSGAAAVLRIANDVDVEVPT